MGLAAYRSTRVAGQGGPEEQAEVELNLTYVMSWRRWKTEFGSWRLLSPISKWQTQSEVAFPEFAFDRIPDPTIMRVNTKDEVPQDLIESPQNSIKQFFGPPFTVLPNSF